LLGAGLLSLGALLRARLLPFGPRCLPLRTGFLSPGRLLRVVALSGALGTGLGPALGAGLDAGPRAAAVSTGESFCVSDQRGKAVPAGIRRVREGSLWI